MNKIIFLDIDGVLNTKAGFGIDMGLDPTKTKLPVDIVLKTNASIILSSSWRYMGYGADSPLQQCLRAVLDRSDAYKISSRILGCTPQDLPNENRDQNIQRWLDNNSHGDIWVALDDLPIISNLGNGHYVIVGDQGLDQTSGNQLLKLLT